MRASSEEDLGRCLDRIVAEGGVDGVLDLWSLQDSPLETATGQQVATAVERSCLPVITLVQGLLERSLAPRLWLVTRKAWEGKAARASLGGLGRIIRVEHPELRCTLVDTTGDLDRQTRELFDELIADTDHQELRLGEEGRQVGVLELAPEDLPQQPHRAAIETAERPAQVEWSASGELVALPANERPPRPGEVQVELRGAVIEPLAGRVPGLRWGSVVGGVVEGGRSVMRVGPARPLATIDSYAPEDLHDLPGDLYLPDALSSVATYVPVHRALIDAADLQPGDRVVIAARGVVAQAAAHLARWCRAWPVVVSEDDLAGAVDPRAPDADEQLRKLLGGQSADVLFVHGTAPPLDLVEVLDDMGRCTWLADGSGQPPLIRAGQTLAAVDMKSLLGRCRPAVLKTVDGVLALLQGGSMPPLPFPHLRLDEVVSETGEQPQATSLLLVDRPLLALTVAPTGWVRPDASYLVVGGLGRLGLAISRELVARGARSLVLVGRSLPSSEARSFIAGLEDQGAQVTIMQADASREQDLQRVLDHVDRCLPPLMGVVHSAGNLADAIVLRQDARRSAAVLGAKVVAGWNLHRLTLDRPLDSFVLFSSAAGLLGSPGQANYAAANTFLDGLAHARRAAGLPAQAIQWGP